MVFWFGEPQGPTAVLMGVSYLFTKTAFLLLLLIGAISLARGVAAGWIELRWLLLEAAYALPGGFLLDTVNKVGVAQSSLICVMMAAAALICLRARHRGLGWLAACRT